MTPVRATAGSVMPDLEAVEGRRIGEGGFAVLPDMAAQFALQNGVEKCAHFAFFAGREKFHSTVAQISDGAGNVKALRYLPD